MNLKTGVKIPITVIFPKSFPYIYPMILVTGGTGLVGSHLLYQLIKKGFPVRAIHRANSDKDAVKRVFSYYSSEEEAHTFFSKIEWLEADLLNIPDLTKAFKGVEKVYHCAALISFDPGKNKELRQINIEGTANIVNLGIAHSLQKLCFISSIATLDANLEEKEISENFTWNQEANHSDYAISKHGAEIEVWRGTQEGLPAVILNPGVILGPGFWNSGSGQIFARVRKGLNYYFPKTTGFVGVKDVAKTAVLAMESAVENDQYICVTKNLSFKDLLDKISQAMDKSAPKKLLKPWMIYIGWIYQNISKFLAETPKQISRHDAVSLFEHTYYSNKKLKKAFNYNFTPLNEVIWETAKIYKKENPG